MSTISTVVCNLSFLIKRTLHPRMALDGAGHAPGCNCFNCLTPADQSFISGGEPTIVSVAVVDPDSTNGVKSATSPVPEPEKGLSKEAQKEARRLRGIQRKAKKLDAHNKSLSLLPYEPVPISYAIQRFTRKVRFAFRAEALVKSGKKMRKRGKRTVRTAKFRFLKENFRSILKIKKIQDKWTCCKARFDTADLDWLARKVLSKKEKENHPFDKISIERAMKILTDGDPSLDSEKGRKNGRTKKMLAQEAVQNGEAHPPLIATDESPKLLPSSVARSIRKLGKGTDKQLLKSIISALTSKTSIPALEESEATELAPPDNSDNISVFQLSPVSPPKTLIEEIQIDSESEESNAMDVEVEVQSPVLNVIRNQEQFCAGEVWESVPHTDGDRDVMPPPPCHFPTPFDDSIADSDSSLSPPPPPFYPEKRNPKRKRQILDSDDELTPPQARLSEKFTHSLLIKPCVVRMERLISPRGPKVYRRIRIRPVYTIPEDARKLIHGAESARKRQTSDSESSDIDFCPSAKNLSGSSSDSTLSNETDSPASPSSEDSEVLVESEEYGASELDEEEELRRERIRNRKRMKPFIILKTVEERRKLREQRRKAKAEKRGRKRARLEYMEAHLGHLEYSPVNIRYAVDVVTKKLHWDVFPFGAKVLGTTLKKKELESLSKAQGSTEWWVLKKAFVLKHFREVFRIKRTMDPGRDPDFVCCKNTVDFLDCKAFLKIFWGISIH